MLRRKTGEIKLNRLTRRLAGDVASGKVNDQYDLSLYRGYDTRKISGVVQGAYLFAILAIGGSTEFAELEASRVLSSPGLEKMNKGDSAYIKTFIFGLSKASGISNDYGLSESNLQEPENLDVSGVLRELLVMQKQEVE